MNQQKNSFNEKEVLHDLAHFLPEQAPLKDFIHHNTLHAFQQQEFHQALTEATTIFGYKTYLEMDEYRKAYKEGRIAPENLERVLEDRIPADSRMFYRTMLLTAPVETRSFKRIGEVRKYWKKEFRMDLDARVHTLLFRITGSYIDQGIATWSFPVHESGFLASVRQLEKNSFSSFFQSKRSRELLLNEQLELTDLLAILVGDETLYAHYLFDQQFAHPGWSGMVAVLEHRSGSLLNPVTISLRDFILLECLLEIDAIDDNFGKNWEPLARFIKEKPSELFAPVTAGTHLSLLQLWHEAFEWTYYDQVLRAVKLHQKEAENTSPTLQALFCMDDRECSIRRYVELLDPAAETFGTPGHFNLEFYFRPVNGHFHTKVCPAPITPSVIIRESKTTARKRKDVHFSERNTGFFGGFFMTTVIGWFSAFKLALNIVRPRVSPLTSVSSLHMDPTSDLEIEGDGTQFDQGLQVGFTVDQMTDRLEGLLKSIGLTENFAPLVYAIGHGSTSVNNTHFAGYDCGACSGRPGSVNARVISFIANHSEVRSKLAERGIVIPETTRFIGGLHDTSRDELSFFDTDCLPEFLKEKHLENEALFQKALVKNAKERSRRFQSIALDGKPENTLEKVRLRTVSLFEPRPELNHATNALCMVGRRSFTKGVFLDRRAFMNSYNYAIDPEGKFLEGILNAVAPVAGGINLEYFFSRVDNQQLGAGSKLPHNVVGLVGVANGIEGDLRTGLPSQMIEVHDPVRLMVVVEHHPEVVLASIQRNPATYDWFSKSWIHLVAVDPKDEQLYLLKGDRFEVYEPLEAPVPVVVDIERIICQSRENFVPALIREN